MVNDPIDRVTVREADKTTDRRRTGSRTPASQELIQLLRGIPSEKLPDLGGSEERDDLATARGIFVIATILVILWILIWLVVRALI